MKKHLTFLLILVGIEISIAQPMNDNLSNAIVISSLPFTHTVSSVNSDAATLENNELICGFNETWWYRFTPAEDITVTLSSEMQGVSFGQLSNDIRIGIFTSTQASHPLDQLVSCINNENGDGYGEKENIDLISGTAYYIQITTFQLVNSEQSIITILEEIPILPVELISFKAQQIKDEIQLFWQTASETNNEGFEIQRSTNGKDFKKLAFVKGNGTTLAQQSYQLIDEDVQADQLYYYRLKQLDFDGSFEYSSIQAVQFKTDKTTLSIVPNPVSKGMAQLTYTTPVAQPLEVFIFDANGQLLQQMRHQVRSGKNTLSLDLTVLDSGIYFVKVVQQDQSLFERMVVQ